MPCLYMNAERKSHEVVKYITQLFIEVVNGIFCGIAAKRDLRLSREIKRLGRYDGLIIDDLGYLQQSRDDMEVVFTLLAERYERGSVLMTSNVPFSKW